MNTWEKYRIDPKKVRQVVKYVKEKEEAGLPMVDPMTLLLLWREDVDLDRLYIYVASSLDQNVLKMSKTQIVIGQPTKFKALAEDTMVVTFKSGVKAYWQVKEGQIDETFEALRSGLFVAKNIDGTWYIVKVLKFKTLDDNEVKALIEEVEGLERALMKALGLRPDVAHIYIPRLLPLLRLSYLDDVYPIHMIEVSSPGSGKSTFWSNMVMLDRVYYTTDVPTEATLVYDGQLRAYGVAYFYKTIVFDEIDKWGSLDRAKFKALLKIMLTGLENGIWTRSTRGGVQFRNKLSFVGLSNFKGLTNPEEINDRTAFTRWLEEIWKLKGMAEAFIERITVLFNHNETFDTNWLTGEVYHPCVLRSLVRYWNRLAEDIEIKVEIGQVYMSKIRAKRHVTLVGRALKALGYEGEELAKLIETLTKIPVEKVE